MIPIATQYFSKYILTKQYSLAETLHKFFYDTQNHNGAEWNTASVLYLVKSMVVVSIHTYLNNKTSIWLSHEMILHKVNLQQTTNQTDTPEIMPLELEIIWTCLFQQQIRFTNQHDHTISKHKISIIIYLSRHLLLFNHQEQFVLVQESIAWNVCVWSTGSQSNHTKTKDI